MTELGTGEYVPGVRTLASVYIRTSSIRPFDNFFSFFSISDSQYHAVQKCFCLSSATPYTECRAKMIPNQPNTKPYPNHKTAGSRRTNKPTSRPPLPLLSAPLPNPPHRTAMQSPDRPDLSNLRLASAINFLKSCRDPTVKVQ